MAELRQVSRRGTRLLFISLQPNFKKASLNLRFYSENIQGEIINDFLFQEEIYYRFPEVLISGYELICIRINHDDIYVCNPLTHETQVLPLGTSLLQCLGFSYLSSSEEYIVVRLFKFQEKGLGEFLTGIEVMKFGKNPNFLDFASSWKKTKKSYHLGIDDGNRAIDEGPVVERTMHWYVHTVKNCILSFDIDDENLYTIGVPCALHQDYISFSVLMNLNGKLCATGIDKTENTLVLKIWGLQERGKSLWVPECAIKFDDLGYGFLVDGNFNFEKMCPSYTSDGELLFGAYGDFYLYNIEQRSFRKVEGPEGCFKIGFIL